MRARPASTLRSRWAKRGKLAMRVTPRTPRTIPTKHVDASLRPVARWAYGRRHALFHRGGFRFSRWRDALLGADARRPALPRDRALPLHEPGLRYGLVRGPRPARPDPDLRSLRSADSGPLAARIAAPLTAGHHRAPDRLQAAGASPQARSVIRTQVIRAAFGSSWGLRTRHKGSRPSATLATRHHDHNRRRARHVGPKGSGRLV